MKQEEITKCRNEINAVLDRFSMVLDCQIVLSAGKVEPFIRIFPKVIEAPVVEKGKTND